MQDELASCLCDCSCLSVPLFEAGSTVALYVPLTLPPPPPPLQCPPGGRRTHASRAAADSVTDGDSATAEHHAAGVRGRGSGRGVQLEGEGRSSVASERRW